ncbi:AAA family ATPase [Coprococcus comes]|uniref:AAA family ATPase n=1 Tax=Coprococcus comes TaxID=410072 RepID=UPI003F88F1CE
MDKWKRQDINNSGFRELCENFYYYKRKMGYGPAAIEEYDASVFICIFNDKEQLINNWKKINYFIAFHVQKNVEKIIEKSNFYICLFVNESIGNEEKSRIQGNSFCAKKYIFEEKLMSEKAYLERVEARIFSLGIEKTVGETFKINQIELQNFRRYEGNLKVDLTGKNEKASAFTLIYAKNGYGKTSIFDGLEYVFKGEVDRIVELLNNNKNQPLKGAIYHNKNCAHRAAYSQIELENGKIIKRNVAAIQDGKNDCRLNKLGKNNGLDIIGPTKDREKWNRIILPHDKIDTFISAHTPTEKYKEWIKGAPELFEEDESFIRSYRALKDKEISLDKVEKEIKELEKELNKIEKSKESVTQLGKLCEEYNTLVKSEDILIFNEKNSNLEIYNNLLNKIAKRIRYIKNEILTMYDSKLMQGEKIRNGDIRDNESLESALKNVEGKKQNYINQREKHAKYGNIEKDIKGIEKKLNELKSEKIPLDTIYEIGEKRVKEEKNRYLELNKEIEEIKKTEEYFEPEDIKLGKTLNDLVNKITEIKKTVNSKEELIFIEEKIEIISKGEKDILFKKQDIQRMKEAINKFDELIELKKKELTRINAINIPENISELSTIKWAEAEQFLSNEEQMQMKKYEECWRELKKELEIREEIQNQENEIAEKTKEICKLGMEFLLNHREQTVCPLCKESFANWEELFERASRVGKTTEKENQKKRQLIINRINEIDIEYEKFYSILFSKKENEQIKLLDQIRAYEREKNNKEIQLEKLEIEIDSLKKVIRLNEEWLKNRDIILTEYSMEKWKIWLENKEAECRKLQSQKEELKAKIERLHTIRRNNKEHIDIKTKQKENIVNDSKLYSMILFMIKKPDEFDVEFERNALKKRIGFLKSEEKKKQNELIQYEDYAQIDENDIKQKVLKCDMEIEILQELKKQASIFESFSPEGMEKSINTWKKEKENYETQLELLYEMEEENSARTYFEKYTKICKMIENQNSNREKKLLQIQEVKGIYEKEKDNLETKLKDYFSQAIMNEIYQKIDPHEIMKNVTYHLNFNEKDEPQLFIEVCEKEKSDKEFYRPETYFSTAQLNTVAFSSFFGRALSVSNLPIKTICIDDPIGHFDDMNILGFTDMIRCILEKQDCQIIMSTHEEKVYQIMKRKLDPNFYNTSFIQLDNSKKVVWDKTNC